MSSRRSPPLGQLQVKALYDFQARESGDLSIYRGDIVVVTSKVSEEWWMGYIPPDRVNTGMFPATYVEQIDLPPLPPRSMKALPPMSDDDGYISEKQIYRRSWDGDDQLGSSCNSKVPPPAYDSYSAPPSRTASPATRSRQYAYTPASPTTQSQGGFKGFMNDHLNPRDPFNPPPPSWMRAVQAPCAPAFPPITLLSSMNKDLSTGLMHNAQSRPFGNPPPLPDHDVDYQDWQRFMEDLDIVTRLSVGQRVISNGAPALMGVAFLPSLFVTKAIEGKMKGGKVYAGQALVERWNIEFFQPRGLDVFLVQGTQRLSGPMNMGTSGFVPYPDANDNIIYPPSMSGMMGMRGGSYGNNNGMMMNNSMMMQNRGGLIGSVMNGVNGGGLNGAMAGLQNRKMMKDMQKNQEDQMKEMQKMQKDMMKGKGGFGMMQMQMMNGGMGMNGMGMNNGMGGMNGMTGMANYNSGMGGGMGMNGMGGGQIMQDPNAFRLVVMCL